MRLTHEQLLDLARDLALQNVILNRHLADMQVKLDKLNRELQVERGADPDDR